MKTINQIIEMAIEFSDFGMGDFEGDPDVQQHLAKQPVIVYIPISSDRFWEAMQKGITINPLLSGRNRDFFFDQMQAADRAHVLAGEANVRHGKHEYNGPIKPLVLVAEKKLLSPVKKSDTLVQQVVAQSGVVKTPMIDGNVRPNDIVSVVYPAKGNSPDIPIRRFIQNAKRGYYEPAIPSAQVSNIKTGRATPPPWQYAVLKYVQNILNYSSDYFDYLIGEEQGILGKTVLREATKVGLQKMWGWTGEDFAKWVFSILPPLRKPDEGETFDQESEIANMHSGLDHDGFNLPFWRVFDKYKDEYAYEVRAGKKTPDNYREDEE